MKKKIRTTEMNNVSLSQSLHDFEIVSIETNRKNRCVIIGLIDYSANKSLRLILNGVKIIYCAGLSMQNVILDAQIFIKQEKSEYYEFCREKLGLNDSFFEENPNLAVLYLEPSVGLELACIFSEIKLNNY